VDDAESTAVTVGEGLAGVPTEDGFALSYYARDQVTIATFDAQGDFAGNAAGEVADGSATAGGAGTSLAAAPDGSFYVAWVDATDGVVFGTGELGSSIDTGTSTVDGAFPSVAVNDDGSAAYAAWERTPDGG